MQISILLISIAILTIINIFFVQCRYSLIRIDINDLEKSTQQKKSSLERCKKIKEKENKILSVCKLVIVISILIIGFLLNDVCKFIFLKIQTSNQILDKAIVVGIIILVCIIEVVVGFFIPRSLAIKNPQKIMIRNSLLLNILYVFIRPFSAITDFIAIKICKLFGCDGANSIEESSKQGDEAVITGDYEENSYDLNKNRYSFEEKQMREILVPRTDMVCIDLDDSEEYIFNLIKEEGYTRYPVCGKDKDDLLGFIHIRDLYNQKLLEDKVDISKILRKITYVSETELTSRVLEKLRKDRVQMAIVVDEYGGTSGIITVEDILEEMVGEIQDEFDYDEELDIKQIGKDSYIVQGTTTIKDINRILDINIEKDGFDSIGGWMFLMLGMDIEVNQSVDFQGYRFKIIELDKFRVVNVKIEKIAEENTVE